MELPKRRILMNAIFKSQFNYCSAIWMFHRLIININITINKLIDYMNVV